MMFKSIGGIRVADSEILEKDDFRLKVWHHLEKTGLVEFPLPCFYRVPNFVGASDACEKLCEMACFKEAQIVHVNADKPQEGVRFHSLEANKTVVVPIPRLQGAMFTTVTREDRDSDAILIMKSRVEGMRRFGRDLDLSTAKRVDLVVVGSVAVSRTTGFRIGKGEGFADMEFGILWALKLVDEKTFVVTTVHECQVFDELPQRLFGPHDVPVDYIVTPNEVIKVEGGKPKPQGIMWSLLHEHSLLQMPGLQKVRTEQEDIGKNVDLAKLLEGMTLNGDDAIEHSRGRPPRGSYRGRRGSSRGGGERSWNRRGGGRKHEVSISEGGHEKGGSRHTSENNENRGRKVKVTVNVNKQNQTVKRTVETTTHVDREATADYSDESDNEPRRRRRITDVSGSGKEGGERRRPERKRKQAKFSVFVGRVPYGARPRDLKESLTERGVADYYVQWFGRGGFAFVRFLLPNDGLDEVLFKLDGLTVHGKTVVVEKARERERRYSNRRGSGVGADGEDASVGNGEAEVTSTVVEAH